MPDDRILGADAARAVGRFKPEGPDGYRAKSLPDAPLRATRAEAEADEREHWKQLDSTPKSAQSPAPPSWREIWKMARFALALKVNKHLAWPRFVRWIAGPGNRIVIHFGVSDGT